MNFSTAARVRVKHLAEPPPRLGRTIFIDAKSLDFIAK
jgi:hypothetical protein